MLYLYNIILYVQLVCMSLRILHCYVTVGIYYFISNCVYTWYVSRQLSVGVC